MARERIHPRVIPDVGAIASELAELHIVDALGAPPAENENKFMAGAVERAHAAIGFHPDADVQYAAARIFDRIDYLAEVAPIHASEERRTLDGIRDHELERIGEEVCELLWRLFARSLDEFAMFCGSAAADMPIDADVVGRVSEDHTGPFASKENPMRFGSQGASA